MKLEQQCCSLELAKKLEDLKVFPESLLAWIELPTPIGTKKWIVITRWALDEHLEEHPEYQWHCAFTVAELGEMLPSYNYYLAYSFKGSKEDEPWSCVWIFTQENRIKHQVYADTEADARAKMLWYLIENKLITL